MFIDINNDGITDERVNIQVPESGNVTSETIKYQTASRYSNIWFKPETEKTTYERSSNLTLKMTGYNGLLQQEKLDTGSICWKMENLF